MDHRIGSKAPSRRVLLLFAPAVLSAHFLEEASGFVAWFNVHVDRRISEQVFWNVNLTALAITIGLVALQWLHPDALADALVVAWLSFLMMANALFHLVGAMVDGRYVPGLLTALLLYLPFYGAAVTQIFRARRLRGIALIASAAVGALPMLTHGYLILFRRSRLF
jgi:hypothetical protein